MMHKSSITPPNSTGVASGADRERYGGNTVGHTRREFIKKAGEAAVITSIGWSIPSQAAQSQLDSKSLFSELTLLLQNTKEISARAIDPARKTEALAKQFRLYNRQLYGIPTIYDDPYALEALTNLIVSRGRSVVEEVRSGKWLFVIENADAVKVRGGSSSDASCLAKKIVQLLGVPIMDPMTDIKEKEVIQKATEYGEKTGNFTSDDIIGTIILEKVDAGTSPEAAGEFVQKMLAANALTKQKIHESYTQFINQDDEIQMEKFVLIKHYMDVARRDLLNKILSTGIRKFPGVENIIVIADDYYIDAIEALAWPEKAGLGQCTNLAYTGHDEFDILLKRLIEGRRVVSFGEKHHDKYEMNADFYMKTLPVLQGAGYKHLVLEFLPANIYKLIPEEMKYFNTHGRITPKDTPFLYDHLRRGMWADCLTEFFEEAWRLGFKIYGGSAPCKKFVIKGVRYLVPLSMTKEGADEMKEVNNSTHRVVSELLDKGEEGIVTISGTIHTFISFRNRGLWGQERRTYEADWCYGDDLFRRLGRQYVAIMISPNANYKKEVDRLSYQFNKRAERGKIALFSSPEQTSYTFVFYDNDLMDFLYTLRDAGYVKLSRYEGDTMVFCTSRLRSLFRNKIAEVKIDNVKFLLEINLRDNRVMSIARSGRNRAERYYDGGEIHLEKVPTDEYKQELYLSIVRDAIDQKDQNKLTPRKATAIAETLIEKKENEQYRFDRKAIETIFQEQGVKINDIEQRASDSEFVGAFNELCREILLIKRFFRKADSTQNSQEQQDEQRISRSSKIAPTFLVGGLMSHNRQFRIWQTSILKPTPKIEHGDNSLTIERVGLFDPLRHALKALSQPQTASEPRGPVSVPTASAGSVSSEYKHAITAQRRVNSAA